MINRIDINEDTFLVIAEVKDGWDPLYDECLSPDEISYCQKSQNRETQYVRAGLRLLVKKFLPMPNEVHQSPTGKPWIGPDVQISFSHKKNFILLGVHFGNRELGVDLEFVEERVDWCLFRERFFSKSEINHLIDLAEKIKSADLTWTIDELHKIFFSVKEAYFKTIDHAFDPLKIEVCFSQHYEGRVETIARLSKSMSGQFQNHLPELKFFSLRQKNNVVTTSL